MGISRHVDGKTESSRFQGHAQYLVVYYELLKPTETITGDRYQTQLMRLSRALKDKRPQYNERHDKVILQQDNARPHVAKVVKTYLETLKWEVLPHPLYSPDLAPLDYHLFRSMAHGLADQHFRSYEEVKNWIDSWIASKDNQFFQRGIRTLPERWEKVVASDGQCFESEMYNQFFTIKPRIKEKNGGSKVVHLLYIYFPYILGYPTTFGPLF
ncbi:mariner Mos1 transposase [Trichonephila clavipes]|nr:mariner Mos1 transposase [Trichonephila clavipes]